MPKTAIKHQRIQTLETVPHMSAEADNDAARFGLKIQNRQGTTGHKLIANRSIPLKLLDKPGGWFVRAAAVDSPGGRLQL